MIARVADGRGMDQNKAFRKCEDAWKSVSTGGFHATGVVVAAKAWSNKFRVRRESKSGVSKGGELLASF